MENITKRQEIVIAAIGAIVLSIFGYILGGLIVGWMGLKEYLIMLGILFVYFELVVLFPMIEDKTENNGNEWDDCDPCHGE